MESKDLSKKTDTHIIIKNIFINLFLVITGAFLFAFSNPNPIIKHGFSLTAWIMYVPLFFIIKRSSIKNCWLYTGLYGMLCVAAYAYWLYNYDPVCLYIALPIAFLGTAILGLLLKSVEKLFIKNAWLVQFLILCTFDYLRTLGFLGMHYGLAAYTQWNLPVIIQSAKIVGVYGLNAFVIFPSLLIFAFLSKMQDKKKYLHTIVSDNKFYDGASYINYVSENEKLMSNASLRNPVIGLCIWGFLFIVILIFGAISLKINEEFDTVTVAAIQHNDKPEENGIENYSESLQQLITLTDEALEINPDIKIVVWPETAFVPSVVYHAKSEGQSDRKKLVNFLMNYVNSRSPSFIIGNQHIKTNPDGSGKEYFNASILFETGKNSLPSDNQIYSKIKLVPFSEYFPYQKYFPHIYKSLLEKEKFFWTPGTEYKIFETNGLNIYTPICFENTFPYLSRNAYKNGARCLCCLANDSWAKSESCQYQHLAMARFRAVENHVPMIISSVSGQTAFINQKGQLKAMANSFTKTYIISELSVIPLEQKPTVYNTIGDIFGYGAAIILLIVLIIRGLIAIIK
jgi:apolipoprotein N-acyltransferase